MTSLSQLYTRAETNADNIVDTASALSALLTGVNYLDKDILMEKSTTIQSLNIENELDIMVRMEEMAKIFQRLLKLEQRRREYRSQIEEKERQTNTRENIQNARKEKRKNRACPYTRQNSAIKNTQ